MVLTGLFQLEQPSWFADTRQANCIYMSPDFFSLEYFRPLEERRFCKQGGGGEPGKDDIFCPLLSRHSDGRMSREAAALTVFQKQKE